MALNLDMVKSRGWSASCEPSRSCEGGCWRSIGISSLGRPQRPGAIRSIVLLLRWLFAGGLPARVGEGLAFTHRRTASPPISARFANCPPSDGSDTQNNIKLRARVAHLAAHSSPPPNNPIVTYNYNSNNHRASNQSKRVYILFIIMDSHCTNSANKGLHLSHGQPSLSEIMKVIICGGIIATTV